MLDLVCHQAPFCVTRAYASASEVGGLIRVVDAAGRPVEASPEAVRRLGARITFVSNDNLGTLDPASLRRTCIRGACVVFRMSCEGLTCSWQAAPIAGQEPTLEEVRVVASSPAALARAKVNVFVSVTVDGRTRRIALSQLARSGPAEPGRYVGPLKASDRGPR